MFVQFWLKYSKIAVTVPLEAIEISNGLTSNIRTDYHPASAAQSYHWLLGSILLWTRDLFGFRFCPFPVVQRLVTWVWRHDRWSTQSHPPSLWGRRQEKMLWITVKIGLERFEDGPRDQDHWQWISGRVAACSADCFTVSIRIVLGFCSGLAIGFATFNATGTGSWSNVTSNCTEFQLQRRAIHKTPIYEPQIDIL